MHVSHRQLDVRVPGQFLSFRQRGPVTEQFRNVRVAARCMKIGNPVMIFRRDADPFQDLFDHQPCFTTFQIWEQFVCRFEAVRPFS